MRASELGRKLEWPEGSAKEVDAALHAVGECGNPYAEGDATERVGRLLLAVTDLARALSVNPELALRDAADARAKGQQN